MEKKRKVLSQLSGYADPEKVVKPVTAASCLTCDRLVQKNVKPVIAARLFNTHSTDSETRTRRPTVPLYLYTNY